jgi:hypothetical protein
MLGEAFGEVWVWGCVARGLRHSSDGQTWSECWIRICFVVSVWDSYTYPLLGLCPCAPAQIPPSASPSQVSFQCFFLRWTPASTTPAWGRTQQQHDEEPSGSSLILRLAQAWLMHTGSELG